MQSGERLLVVGIGTGEDLRVIPPGVLVVGIDLTPAMLSKARTKRRAGDTLLVMDATRLGFKDESFDAVLLSLVVAVVDDPARCLSEADRVLRAGGRAVVMDKFVPEGRRPSVMRRAANVALRVLFTDVTLAFGDLLRDSRASLVAERDEPFALGGAYRLILLRKPARG